tara:strand:- start:311 stop:991 length:681 start_codon:yes stop_codon:yes gene_type:complete
MFPIVAKRLTEKQKQEIIKLFFSGINVDSISKQYNCTKLTVSRNLKKNLGESKYKELAEKSKLINDKRKINDYVNFNAIEDNANIKKKVNKSNFGKKAKEESFKIPEFVEVTPLLDNFDNLLQKDLSSVPLSTIDFPKTVFMIVNKNVELEVRYLSDFPKWQFLSQDELKRKTIEIYFDLKIAKSYCGKEQKVIKVPNTQVFQLVAPILLSRGISRIVSSDKLIAL